MNVIKSYFYLCLKSSPCLVFFSVVTRVIPSLPPKQTCSQMQRQSYRHVNNFWPLITHLSARRKVWQQQGNNMTTLSAGSSVWCSEARSRLSAKAEPKVPATRAARIPYAFTELGKELSPTLQDNFVFCCSVWQYGWYFFHGIREVPSVNIFFNDANIHCDYYW